MGKQHQQAVETRRLYKFEQTFLRPQYVPGTNKRRSLKFLQELAIKVWEKHGRRGMRPPMIRFTKDVNYSCCLGYRDICLTLRRDTVEGRAHNTIEVLLHELTHAVGYNTHNRGFANKYIELLVEYAGCDEGELRLGMALFNVKT